MKQTKNLLSLHEAIVIALIHQPIRRANFEDIASFIEARNLYPNRKGNIPLATQVMLRSTKSKGAYCHLFEQIGPKHIGLRDSYVNFSIRIAEALDAILGHNNELFHPSAIQLKVVDIELESNRKIKISPDNVVCILTLPINNTKTGRKKFIYLKEKDLRGKEIIGRYTVQQSIEKLYELIDPLNNYLAIVSDSTLVNVGCYKLSKNKVLKPNTKDKLIVELPQIKFSESIAAKFYKEKFELIQKHYLNRISLQLKILAYKNDFEL